MNLVGESEGLGGLYDGGSDQKNQKLLRKFKLCIKSLINPEQAYVI
jgi:hypothetical protein